MPPSRSKRPLKIVLGLVALLLVLEIISTVGGTIAGLLGPFVIVGQIASPH